MVYTYYSYIYIYRYIYICKSRWHHWSEWCFSWIQKKTHTHRIPKKQWKILRIEGLPTYPRIGKIAGEWTGFFFWRCLYASWNWSWNFQKVIIFERSHITFDRSIIFGAILSSNLGGTCLRVCSCKMYLLHIFFWGGLQTTWMSQEVSKWLVNTVNGL